MRPLFLMFEDDLEAFDQDYEYMYGDDLLVSPVLLPSVNSWSVYLPGPETWVHLWTGDVVEGYNHYDTASELGYPPVFYKQNSLWKDLFEGLRAEFGNKI